MLLPLFPLNTVLFPGMSLPLHVFEHRYRMMLNDCIERDAPFGIALIKEGQEVGGPAVPFSVGTTTRAQSVRRLPDGRMEMSAHGERRFQIDAITRQRPYMIADAHLLPEPVGEGAEALVEVVRGEFEAYVRVLIAIAGGYRRDLPVPTEPVALSWGVAQTLVNESTEARQAILEAATARGRLELERPMLREAIARARATLLQRMPPEGRRN